jgi:hypothetical protein
MATVPEPAPVPDGSLTINPIARKVAHMKAYRTPSLALAALLAFGSAPSAYAQNTGSDSDTETVRQETVYGDDSCSKPSSDNEIIVCVKLNEAERFRVPEILRGNPNAPENQAWATKIESISRISKFGTDSCSPSGLGGFTGCTQQLIDTAMAARRQDAKVDWSAAIAAERQKRIDAIDSNARAAEQAYQQQLATKDERDAEMAAARARLDAQERGETVAPLPATDKEPATDKNLAVPPGAGDAPKGSN